DEEPENKIHDRALNNTPPLTNNPLKKVHYTKLYGIIALAAVGSGAAITWGAIQATRQQASMTVQHETHPIPLIIATTDSVKEVQEDTAIGSRQEDKMQAQAKSQLYTRNAKAPVHSKPEHLQKNIKGEKNVPISEKKTEEQVLNAVNKNPETPADEQPGIVPQRVAAKEILINNEITFEVVFEHLPDMEFK